MELYGDRTAKKVKDKLSIIDDDYVAHNFNSYNEALPTHEQLPSQQPNALYSISSSVHSQQTVVIATKPADTEYVETYMHCSIANFLFCCFPLGIVAIVVSRMARDELVYGNIEGAKRTSQIALLLNIAGTVLGVILYSVVIISCITG